MRSDGNADRDGTNGMTETLSADVVVVGGGNAALSAALAAAEAGARVRLLEAAPEEERGGNSTYTAGAMRVVFDGTDALRALMPDLSERELAETDFGNYTEANYYDDMARLTQYRADPDLVEQLVTRSHPTLLWLREKGVRLQPSYGRQAFKREDGRFRFWGGLAVEAWGGGPGLVAALYKAAAKAQVAVHYRAPASSLLTDDRGARGVRARIDGRTVEVSAPAVVLACGGFEANAAWRARYLGPGWDLAKVRGTRFNQGDGIRMGLEAGAMPAGNWSGCHAVAWDRNAPAVRRPRRRRRLPEAQLSLLDHRERGGRALRRRRRGFSELHLCRLRPQDPGAARTSGVAGLRLAGHTPAAGRVPHPPSDQGEGRHAGGSGCADGGH